MTNEDLATELVQRINALIANKDIREDLAELIDERIPCAVATQDHPFIQTEGGKVGLLGFLNGIVGVIPTGPKKGLGYIQAVFEDADPTNLLYFKKTETAVEKAVRRFLAEEIDIYSLSDVANVALLDTEPTWEIHKESNLAIMRVNGANVAVVTGITGHIERPDTWFLRTRDDPNNDLTFETMSAAKKEALKRYDWEYRQAITVVHLIANFMQLSTSLEELKKDLREAVNEE